MESDAYGGPKCVSIICSNDDEATYGMGTTSQRTWFDFFASKVIVDDVLLYGRIDRQLLACFRTVLAVLKHPHAILNLKIANDFRIGASL